jgi:hypothetical protein
MKFLSRLPKDNIFSDITDLGNLNHIMMMHIAELFDDGEIELSMNFSFQTYKLSGEESCERYNFEQSLKGRYESIIYRMNIDSVLKNRLFEFLDQTFPKINNLIENSKKSCSTLENVKVLVSHTIAFNYKDKVFSYGKLVDLTNFGEMLDDLVIETRLETTAILKSF